MKQLAMLFLFLVADVQAVNAAEFDTKHKVVIHVASADPETQNISLNYVTNLLKYYGPENVTVEVVANGPGLSIMNAEGPQAKRIPAFVKNGVTFSACEVTMKKVERKIGKPVLLAEGVQKVPAGLPVIIELQEKGYSYVRP